MKKQLAFGYGGLTDMTPCIYRVQGRHEGMVEGILLVKVVEQFKHLSWSDDFLPDGEAIGYRPGGGMTALVRVTDEQAQQLRTENARRKVLAELAAEKNAAEVEQYERDLAASGLCPHCHTWCYGDCEAS